MGHQKLIFLEKDIDAGYDLKGFRIKQDGCQEKKGEIKKTMPTKELTLEVDTETIGSKTATVLQKL